MQTLPNWSFAHGQPDCRARIRSVPEDFRVDEVLGFAADGDGEHLLLQVEKRGANTGWVARELARIAGIRARDVSFAGRKDRNAMTTQHFTLWLGKRTEPDWNAHANSEYRVLSSSRHRRKLRTGALRGNHFRLVLRELSQPGAMLEARLARIRERGVPNYFGPQRFGRGGNNLARATQFFADSRSVRDREQRSLLLSTARSLIFNAVLSERAGVGTWNTALRGEACMLEGTHSVFRGGELDDALRARIAGGDVHPTGPLWGVGDSMAELDAVALENRIAALHPEFARGLETQGMVAARRSLRLPVPDLQWQHEDERTLILEFFLPAGCYATTLLRELVNLDNTDTGVHDDAEEN